MEAGGSCLSDRVKISAHTDTDKKGIVEGEKKEWIKV